MADLKTAVSEKDHVAGSSGASVTLVEYGDYECPDCGVAYPIVKKLQKHFGERLRFVFRNFPLPQHPYAEAAAEAAEFAANTSPAKFWAMHDAIYEHQDQLSLKVLERLAEHVGLNGTELHTELGAHTFRPRVVADLKSGEASGVRGTPTFFINGKFFDDSYDYETLVEAIQAYLGGAER